MKFWKEFGQVLKEGPAEDFSNRERICKLLRFTTTHSVNAEQDQSLDDYIGRMKEGQDKIFYITADSYQTAKNSPHLEVFKKKGVEVVLMYDRIDEWLMSHLTEYDGKKFQDVARATLDLGDMEDEQEKEEHEKAEEYSKVLREGLRGAGFARQIGRW